MLELKAKNKKQKKLIGNKITLNYACKKLSKVLFVQ